MTSRLILKATPMTLIFYIFAFLYVGVALFALFMTCYEFSQKHCKIDIYTVTGMLLCLAWPVLVVAILVSRSYAGFSGRRMSRSNG
ncbi:hypothetical protein RSK20926_01227 [Roseobacter sp. SK209-2-6]|uniref:hypothetical protein n=1 Tax=Roseobacter sp. SK209-2-6 TaxID=388739 RepID=UPI0000F3F4B0|nr:hypothetical protein [Roseobacter sp. SK209-2-6]EBA14574.1 hypothetical protein RSK20926_01227 [Roseobacter sp. SK209-2-6]